MKSRVQSLARVLGLAGSLGVGFVAGIACDADTDVEEDNIAALRACGLDDGTVDRHAQVHACDPGNQKKTTICHIPPGNPANAHTLCIGNAAVPAHLDNHGDHLGVCDNEQPCPPPPPSTGAGGTTGAAGVSGGSGGAPGSAGTGGAPPVILG